MGYANAIRTHLTTGSAVAGASILALGLVIATPDDHGARNEVRAVQLAARTLPTAAERWDASLREFIRNRIEPVANEVSGGRSADAPAAVVNSSTARVTTPPRMVSSTGPAVNFQKADATTLAASTTALAIPSIFAPLEAVLGVLILFGPLIVLVVLACPPCAVINFLSYFLPIPTVPLVAAATTATVEESTTVAPGLTSDTPQQTTEIEESDTSAPAVSDDKRTGVERGSLTEPKTSDEQMATETVKDVTENVAPQQEPTEKSTVSDAEAQADNPEPTKPVSPQTTPRPVVRDSLGTEKKTSEPSHRGTGGRATTEGPAGSRAATAGSSSDDSSSDDDSSNGNSSGGDAGS